VPAVLGGARQAPQDGTQRPRVPRHRALRQPVRPHRGHWVLCVALMIVGVDSGSRRLAVCYLAGSEVGFEWYETPPSTPEEEIEDLIWWLKDTGISRHTHQVYLEPVVIGVRGGAQTAIRHALTIGGVVATVGGTLISPSTWKASVLGYGSADKDDVQSWVEHTSEQAAEAICALASTKPRRQDLRDAYCIALHGDLARRHPDQLGAGRRVPRKRAKRPPG
jgi:hypothetical protein